MKKILFVFALFFVFSINANAQEAKLTGKEAATKEATDLQQLVGLSDSQTQDFVRLFEMKHEIMENNEASLERKSEMSNIVDMKIQATLTEEQFKKLKLNTSLYEKLKK